MQKVTYVSSVELAAFCLISPRVTFLLLTLSGWPRVTQRMTLKIWMEERMEGPVWNRGWKCMKSSTALWDKKAHRWTIPEVRRSSLYLYSEATETKERWQFHHLVPHWCNTKAESCSPGCPGDCPQRPETKSNHQRWPDHRYG